MQSGNAGRLFKHAPALVGPRLDDLADAALMHQRRRARAGGCVGEQHGDVARAHFAAVDAEDRALFAYDAAGDFERFRIVERRRRVALAVVDGNGDFGVIARRALGIAGEDHVVHLGRAHGLVGRFSHDPAYRFDQVRLAAAVRADDAGQSGFDHKVGRFDEGFKADQAQPRELHAGFISITLAAAAKGIVIGSPERFPVGRIGERRIGDRMNRAARKRNSASGLSTTFALGRLAPAPETASRRARNAATKAQKNLIPS